MSYRSDRRNMQIPPTRKPGRGIQLPAGGIANLPGLNKANSNRGNTRYRNLFNTKKNQTRQIPGRRRPKLTGNPKRKSSTTDRLPGRKKPGRTRPIHPCSFKNCREAKCVYDKILQKAKCVCPGYRGLPPDNRGRCPKVQPDPIPPLPPEKKEKHPCDHVDCGEAGCVYIPVTQQTVCLCMGTDDNEPVYPDKNKKCPDHTEKIPGEGPTHLPQQHPCGQNCDESLCFVNHETKLAACGCMGPFGKLTPDKCPYNGDDNDVCTLVNCGDAGCMVQDGRPHCVCPGTKPLRPPDKDGHCPPISGEPFSESVTHLPESHDNPCKGLNCELGCLVHEETKKAMCACEGIHGPIPPDDSGKCPPLPIFGPGPQGNPCNQLKVYCPVGQCKLMPDSGQAYCDCSRVPRNSTETCDPIPKEHPCSKKNCGEGGCYIEESTGKAECTCLHFSQKDVKPDDRGHCPPPPRGPGAPYRNRTIDAEEDLANFLKNSTLHHKTLNSSETQYRNLEGNRSVSLVQQISNQNHHQVAYIVTPLLVLSVASLGILLCFLWRWRRRHEGRIRAAHAQSPISWLHRQESFQLLDQMAVISKNPGYYTPNLDPVLLQSLKDRTIAREKLSLLDEIGEGAFGKVYKGEITWEEGRTEKVAVKVLKEGASRETQDDFKREVEIMSTFDHANILKLIGVVANDKSSPFMVFEYMEHGDLAELLRNNDPTIHKGIKIMDLKQSDLVDIATQIANGMVYLTSQHFVHRDLAARNCLVGAELHVKISDFGMSRDIYTCDYYRIGGSRMLPVRWMSPESVKYGRFTTESDVWAYGVVLWEIFSYGKQPYYGHTNEEVIRFIEDSILLQRPEECPSTIYHIMLGCWRSNPKDRFTFDKIHHHLVELDRQVVKCYNQLDLCDNQIEV